VRIGELLATASSPLTSSSELWTTAAANERKRQAFSWATATATMFRTDVECTRRQGGENRRAVEIVLSSTSRPALSNIPRSFAYHAARRVAGDQRETQFGARLGASGLRRRECDGRTGGKKRTTLHRGGFAAPERETGSHETTSGDRAARLGARRSGGAQTTTLHIGTTPTDTGAQVYYAIDLGLFKKAGFEVEVSSLNAGTAIATAVSAGSFDIGQSAVSSLAVAHEHNIPFVIIAPGGAYSSKVPTSE